MVNINKGNIFLYGEKFKLSFTEILPWLQLNKNTSFFFMIKIEMQHSYKQMTLPKYI